MADITMDHKFTGFDAITTRNNYIRIASQMWEYRFGGDQAEILRAMRDDFEVVEASANSLTFIHDGEEHMIVTEDLYAELKADAIRDIVETAEDEMTHATEACGWLAPYITIDRDMLARDLEIGGDADGYLASWDGCVEELSTITLEDDGKYYGNGSWYTWRTN